MAERSKHLWIIVSALDSKKGGSVFVKIGYSFGILYNSTKVASFDERLSLEMMPQCGEGVCLKARLH